MIRTKDKRDSQNNGDQAPVKVERWGALAGRWTFAEGRATYEGPESEPGTPRRGVAIGNIPFRDGRVTTRIKLTRNDKTTAGIVFGFRALDLPYFVAQIGAFDRAYALSEYRPDLGWQALSEAGLLSNLDVGSEHVMQVELAGQDVSMKVDDVIVLNVSLPRPVDGTGMGLFAWDDAQVLFDETTVATVKPKVFVIMPFSEPFQAIYDDVIRPVATKIGFEIVRVDEIHGPGIILEDIQQQIAQSHAVIAEISSKNPNVFYELGFAHARQKPAVLLVRRDHSQDLPFDIRGYRAIFYDDTIGGKKTVERTLKQHLGAVLRER